MPDPIKEEEKQLEEESGISENGGSDIIIEDADDINPEIDYDIGDFAQPPDDEIPHEPAESESAEDYTPAQPAIREETPPEVSPPAPNAESGEEIEEPEDFFLQQQKSMPEKREVLAIETMLKEEKNLEKIAEKIIEGTFLAVDILKKDSIEKFLDFVLLKVKTGIHYIPSLAYPAKRIADSEMEEKIIELINVHLFPDIILPILKYFTRNVHNSDTNLHLAYLVTSEEIITSIYNTFLTFKKDIFEPDRRKKTLNVKRIQQFSPRSDDRFSSPLDAACRFKYILEFIALKQNVEHIYTPEMIMLSKSVPD